MKFTKKDVRSVGLLSACPLVVSVDGDSYTTFQLDRAFTDGAKKLIRQKIQGQQESAKQKIAASYENVKKWSKK